MVSGKEDSTGKSIEGQYRMLEWLCILVGNVYRRADREVCEHRFQYASLASMPLKALILAIPPSLGLKKLSIGSQHTLNIVGCEHISGRKTSTTVLWQPCMSGSGC